jgi:nitrate reductase molybdenum cofactor assembly chaperone NarJ/NarW
MMGIFAYLAEAFRYPAAGRIEWLRSGLARLPEGPVKRGCAVFLQEVGGLSLSQWEELYTHTLDLNPAAAPYIGFQVWGESYQRGNFLSQLNRALCEQGIDLDGELPDHLIAALRYLDVASQPLPELLEALGPAIDKMQAALRKSQPGNPYIDLMETVKQASSIRQPDQLLIKETE